MRGKVFVFLILFILSVTSVYAQKTFTFYGYIYGPDERPVEGAIIINKLTKEQAVSSYKGAFSIQAEYYDTLAIYKTGMKPYFWTVKDKQNEFILSKAYQYINDVKEISPYWEFKYIYQTSTSEDSAQKKDVLYLPNNNYLGVKPLTPEIPYFKINNLSLGYYQNNFLNPLYGQNKLSKAIKHKIGIYGGADIEIGTPIPLMFNYSIFRSRYKYDKADYTVVYTGWRSSLSADLHLTNIKYLRDFIPHSYFGIGYQLAIANSTVPLFDNEQSDNRSNQLFWTLSFELEPFKLLNKTGLINDYEIEEVFDYLSLSLNYAQSLNTKRYDAFNTFSFGVNYNLNANVKDIDLYDLPGSDSYYGQYYSDNFLAGVSVLIEGFRTNNYQSDTSIAKGLGITYNIDYFIYPIMFDLSYFKHTDTKHLYNEDIPIKHRGLEASINYMFSQDPEFIVPYLGFGYQLAGITNSEYVLDNQDQHISGFIWRGGLLLYIPESNMGLGILYKHSFFRKFTYYQFLLSLSISIPHEKLGLN